MTGIESQESNMALGEEARNFYGIDLVVEQHVFQAALAGHRAEARDLAAPPHEQKSDVRAVTQSRGQIEENIHSLRDTHVARVDEYRAAGQSGCGEVNAAPHVIGWRQPVPKQLNPRPGVVLQL